MNPGTQGPFGAVPEAGRIVFSSAVGRVKYISAVYS